MDTLESEVSAAFRSGVAASLGRGFESRPSQVDMARRISRCLESGKTVVIEAGTGLGKSLAYLVPLLIHCEKHGIRAIVSTHTRNLQQQLVNKDFDLARRATGKP